MYKKDVFTWSKLLYFQMQGWTILSWLQFPDNRILHSWSIFPYSLFSCYFLCWNVWSQLLRGFIRIQTSPYQNTKIHGDDFVISLFFSILVLPIWQFKIYSIAHKNKRVMASVPPKICHYFICCLFPQLIMQILSFS